MRATNLWAWGVLLGIAAPAWAGDWAAIPAGQVTDKKPGYGGLSGVVVDHATGEVYLCVSDLGLFRSKDQGKSWAPLEQAPPKGRTEQPGCLLIDPTGKSKRTVLARVYGGPVVVGDLEAGKWGALGDKSIHVDWCVVDWTDPEMGFVLALKHESGGTLIASHDGGKSVRRNRQGLRPRLGFRQEHGRGRGGKNEGEAEAGPGAHHRRRQDVPAVRRLRRDGVAEVARRHAVLAGGRRPDPHDRRRQDVGEGRAT